MVRLIDADAYAAKMKDRQSACREWIEDAKAEGDEAQTDRARQAFATFVEAKLTLDKMPTIDAIPVEWLKGLMLSTEDDVDKVEYAWIMREWESEKKEQEVQK